jgi:hypothetical protein
VAVEEAAAAGASALTRILDEIRGDQFADASDRRALAATELGGDTCSTLPHGRATFGRRSAVDDAGQRLSSPGGEPEVRKGFAG